MTGHSLGRNKLEHLLNSGGRLGRCWAACCAAFTYQHAPPASLLCAPMRAGASLMRPTCHGLLFCLHMLVVVLPPGAMTRKEIEEAYAISRRIEAEERWACVPAAPAVPAGRCLLEEQRCCQGCAGTALATPPPMLPSAHTRARLIMLALPQPPNRPRSCLDNAVMVFTSTRQEVDEQWGL